MSGFSVAEVLERLQDLLLTSDAADEKKTDEQDEIHALLAMLKDWSQNRYRREELAEHRVAKYLLVPALQQAEHLSLSVLGSLLDVASALAAASSTHRQALDKAGATTVTAELAALDISPRVTAAAYKLLSHLALSKECAARMSTDVVPLLQTVLMDETTHVRVVREVVGTLANVAGHVTAQTALTESSLNKSKNNDDGGDKDYGTLQALCNNMQRHATDTEIQLAACQVWWNLLAAAPPQRNKKDALPPIVQAWQTLDGMGHVLGAMELHAKRGDIQEAACGALSCVVWRPRSEDDNVRALATTLVLQALASYDTKENPSVLTTACRALANTCRDCTDAASLVLDPVPLGRLHAIAESTCHGDADQVRLALAVLDAWSALAVHAKYAACTTLVQAAYLA